MMYGEGIINRLPAHSPLRNTDNDGRKVIVNTIGALLDDFSIEDSKEGVYLQEATGSYLDCHGKDLGLKRRHDESDEHYRMRLIYETLGYLSVKYLQEVYDLPLYHYTGIFSFSSNTLTSDNPYISGNYMSIIDDDSIKSSLSSKFVVGDGLILLNDDGFLDYIMVGANNVLTDYISIYGVKDVSFYFDGKTSITSAKLGLPDVTDSNWLFNNCTGLTSVELDLPNAIETNYLFKGCTNLTSVELHLPKSTSTGAIFEGCTSLTTATFDFPQTTACSRLFYGCTNLESVDLNTPFVEWCNEMFYNCSNLTEFNFDLDNVEYCQYMFRNCTSLESVDLHLPAIFNAEEMFRDCTDLTSVKISSSEPPYLKQAKFDRMFKGCTSLKTVVLDLRKQRSYSGIFAGCTALETIDVKIVPSSVESFKNYVLGLELEHLTSFKINGEEVDLS